MVYCTRHKVRMVRPDLASHADADPHWRTWVCPEDSTERVSDGELMRTLGGIEGVRFVTYTRELDGTVKLRGHV